jgi:hypothetical protein
MGRDGPGDRARIIAGDGESYLQAPCAHARRKYGSALFAVLALVAERREWETGHTAPLHYCRVAGCALIFGERQ